MNKDRLISYIRSFPDIITYFSKDSAEKRVCANLYLKRDFTFKNITTASLPVEVIRKTNDIETQNILRKYLGKQILFFSDVLEKNISKKDLGIFYNNINNVNVEIKKIDNEHNLSKSYLVAQYNMLDNRVELNGNKTSDVAVFHELLHASTTVFSIEYRTAYCGFSQVKVSNNNELIKIGNGINEGYTQYLTQKLFSNSYEKSYEYEKAIAKKIEELIGNKKMQSLYFNADLKGLVDELSAYSSLEEAYYFIVNLDFLCKHRNDKYLDKKSIEMITQTMKSINIFLIKSYLEKLISEYKSYGINNFPYLIAASVNQYIRKIPYIFCSDGKKILTLDDELINTIIEMKMSKYDTTISKKTWI